MNGFNIDYFVIFLLILKDKQPKRHLIVKWSWKEISTVCLVKLFMVKLIKSGHQISVHDLILCTEESIVSVFHLKDKRNVFAFKI